VAIFLLDCARRGFDPWANEAYLMLYPGQKYVRHTGIYGFRRKGEESGKYRGRIEPEFSADGETWKKVWLNRNEPPAAARCAIMRADHDGPDWGYAVYDEFVPMQDETRWDQRQQRRVKTGRRVPTPVWRCAAEGGKPSVMLGKVAEAIAWRAAFPNRFNGYYVPEEFERLKVEHQDDQAAARRRAAYEAATQPAETRERIVVQGTVVGQEQEPSEPTAPEMPANARDLLLAELDEQAEILGKTTEQMSARWAASRGRPISEATDAELREFVYRWREYVLRALREANRDDEANQYAQAPEFGTCEELFGRGPAIPEPPADFDTAGNEG
jgi:hypothetical protein